MNEEDIAAPPKSGEDVHETSSIHSELSKSRLKDAVTYYENLLFQNNLISDKPSEQIQYEATLIGEELYNTTLDLLADKILTNDEELIHCDEDCGEFNFEKVEEVEEADGEDDSNEYEYTPALK